ncbi:MULTISPECIES: MATE family efflux transporter [unclassified Streptococcus]|uniref:MATE family efflux transporter n=1 Tax=unclassified Streptococcus TaxID=2608887 RepID=UPI001072CAF0|nr:MULTISPECIES: MATE family efflux transporter [unclassified Streptococcus]MBF0806271.1 MATE family efflux transporter [Streptococcus sp. 19428wA2_WM07]TFU28120.1 MATE family efflux transporter [Streptococcus sp. WM07]
MEKINRRIFDLALPAMLENFLQMVMGVVDSYLVASLGLVAISGVSLASSVLAIYQALFLALVATLSSFVAKAHAEKEEGWSEDLARSGLGLTIMLSLVLGLLSVLAGPTILSWMGTDSRVAAAGGLYISLVGGTIVFQGLMMSLGAVLRIWGRPQEPMWVSLVVNFLNVLLSTAFLYGLDWGLMGVALGTVLSRFLGALYLWWRVPFPLLGQPWIWDWSLVGFALPAAGERLMMRLGDFLLMVLVVSFGTEVVAGNAIGETLIPFHAMPALGLATAGVILIAQARGQEDWEQVDALVSRLYGWTLALMFPIGLAFYLFGQPLTQLYNSDTQVVAASQTVLLFALLGTPMIAGTLIYTSLWQGLGNAKLPFYATSIGMWILRLGFGAFLGHFLGWGLSGIWIGTLVDNGFRWWWLRRHYRSYRKEQV